MSGISAARMKTRGRRILLIAGATVVLLSLVAVQLYLYSPWHLRPAQGRQYCKFFTVEQGNGLEASGPVIFVPPPALRDAIPEEEAWPITSQFVLRQTSRAPPI